MAANAEESVDNRRCRRIYEALDAGDPKAAIRAADQLLKKHDSPTAKVLKAFGLAKLGGRNTEALAICDEVVDSTDELNEQLRGTLVMVYKSLKRMDKCVALYEAAAETDPNDAELAKQLFGCYVKAGDYKSAQTVALTKLHNVNKEPKYFFWYIGCLVAQGYEGGPFMMLAERMMAKAETEGWIDNYEQLLLYVELLEAQEKYEDCIALVLRLNVFKVEAERLRLLAELCGKASKWACACALWRELFISYNPDNWMYIAGYLDAVFKLIDGYSPGEGDDVAGLLEGSDVVLSEAVVDATAEAAQAVVEQVQAASEIPKRGPVLAGVELESRLLSRQEGGSSEKLEDLLYEYFTLFGGKRVAFVDMRRFLGSINADRRQGFVDRLTAVVNECESAGEKEKAVHCGVRVATLSRALGLEDVYDNDAHKARANELVAAYVNSDCEQVLERGERLHGDDYLALAQRTLVKLAEADGNWNACVEALAAAHYGSTRSPHNFEFAIAQVEAFRQLNAFRPIYNLYSNLHFNYIQLDTLSFYYLPDCAHMGYAEETAQLCMEVAHFHDGGDTTVPDYVAKTFYEGSYSKTTEFVEFSRKLARSHMRALADTEMALHHVAHRSNSPDDLRVFLADWSAESSDEFFSSLSNNSDYSAVPCWESDTTLARVTAARVAADAHTTAVMAAKTDMIQLVYLAVQGKTDEVKESLPRLEQRLAAVSPTPIPTTATDTDSFTGGVYTVVLKAFAVTAAVAELEANYAENVEGVVTLLGEISEGLSALVTVVESVMFEQHGDVSVYSHKATRLLDRLYTEAIAWSFVLFLTWTTQLPLKKKNKDLKAAARAFKASYSESLDKLNGLVESALASEKRSGFSADYTPTLDVFKGDGGNAAAVESVETVVNDIVANETEMLERLKGRLAGKLDTLKDARVK